MGASCRQFCPVAKAMELFEHGPAALRRALPTWFRRTKVAAVPGPAA